MSETTNYPNNQEVYEDEINLRELFHTLKEYKFIILLTTIIITLLTGVYLYFAKPVYKAYSIVDIKTGSKNSAMSNDFLTAGLMMGSNDETEKQIEILKTFSVNAEPIKKVNYKIQYFEKKNLKTIELYDDLPVNLEIKILDKNIADRLIKLIPLDNNAYKIEYTPSILEKIKSYFSDKEAVYLNEKYQFNKIYKNRYFSIRAKINKEFDTPVFFKINGSTRDIYESIIKNRLSTSQVNKKASLIQISFEDNIPTRAKEYVNTLVDNFLKQSIISKSEQYDNIISFINEQLDNIKNRLSISENRLEKYRINKNVIKPSIQAKNLIEELSNIDIQISQNFIKQKLIDNIIYYIKRNRDISSIAPSLVDLNDEPTIDLIKTLQQAQLKEREYSREYTDKFPELIKLRDQIRNLRAKIYKNIKNLKRNYQSKIRELTKVKRKYERILKSLPKKEKALVNMQRDYEVNSKMYSYLLEKRAEKEILKAAITSDFKVIDRAYTPSKPIKPKKMLILVVGIIAGIIIGIFLAFLKAFLDNKITNKEDIERLTSIPIYGVIPFIKRKEIKLEVLEEPESYFAEAFRKLRTNLQFNLKKHRSNVVLITSTIPGEGKTTTTANLTAVFAMMKAKCIAINLDLRKPTLHKLFEVDNKVGMSNLLAEDKTLDEVIHHTKYNIDIIPAGPTPPNPSELMLSENFEIILKELKNRYDYIFIDSPPVGLVTDTLSLMQYADFILVVLRENYAKKEFIKEFEKLSAHYSIKHKGIVLNASKEIESKYGYSYKYRYGYK